MLLERAPAARNITALSTPLFASVQQIIYVTFAKLLMNDMLTDNDLLHRYLPRIPGMANISWKY